MHKQNTSTLTIKTHAGDVRGTHEHNGIRVWRGLPYAAAPVGNRRFMAPQPHAPWEGVRDTTRFGPVCPQPSFAGQACNEPMDEDCLFLNVWSPEGAHNLPVMVWIHGGAYLIGSGSSPDFCGTHLAAKGPAVIVTLNYRLGYRGFLDLSSLPGSQARFTTNNGIRDQIAALEWVRDNISAFGGNPDNVTLFGQSAGGSSVTCLLASPLAKGLFHAAIAQSPPADAIFNRTLAHNVTKQFLALIGKPQASFDDICNADQDALLAASLTLVEQITRIIPSHIACQPIIDNEVLLDRPADSIAAGHGSTVPLLIGSNADEGSLFAHPPMPPLVPVVAPNSREFLRQHYPDTQDAIVAAYTQHGRFGTEVSIGGDGMVTMPVIHLAEALSQHKPVFLYHFSWTNNALMEKKLGTPHGLDIPFVFGTLQNGGMVEFNGPDANEMLALSEVFQHAWLTFARNHKPELVSLTWPPYDTSKRSVLILDRDITIAHDPDHRQRQAWGPLKPLD